MSLHYVRASGEDQAKIQAFLNDFPNDYLAEQVSKYIKQQPGGLYLAMDDETIVGTAVISFPKPHEAYMSGMRVSPSRQGQGIGEAFAQFQLGEIERLGVSMVRCLVDEGNTLSRRLLEEKLGFQLRTRWRVGVVEGLRDLPLPSLESGPAWSVDMERMGPFWQKHRQDLWSGKDPWVPQSWSLDDIRIQVENGNAAVHPQALDRAVDGLALYTVHNQERLDLHYLRGTGGGIEEIVRYLGMEARAWGLNQVRFGLPDSDSTGLTSAPALTVSFDWRGLVFEKRFDSKVL